MLRVLVLLLFVCCVCAPPTAIAQNLGEMRGMDLDDRVVDGGLWDAMQSAIAALTAAVTALGVKVRKLLKELGR